MPWGRVRLWCWKNDSPEPKTKAWCMEAEATVRNLEIFPCPGGGKFSAEPWADRSAFLQPHEPVAKLAVVDGVAAGIRLGRT